MKRKILTRFKSSGLVSLIILLSVLPSALSSASDISIELPSPDTAAYEETGSQTEPDDSMVILDNNYLYIAVLGFSEDVWGNPYANLKIENRINKEYAIQARQCDVNGYMVMPQFTCLLDALGTEECRMTFDKYKLELSGIEEIVKIHLKFILLDLEDYTIFYQTLFLDIETGSDYIQQEKEYSGNVIYDDNDIIITLLPLEYYSEIYLPEIPVCIENNSRGVLELLVNSLEINGVAVTPLFLTDVSQDKKCFTYIYFDETGTDLENQATIDKLELSFYFMRSGYEDNFLSTEPIILTFD